MIFLMNLTKMTSNFRFLIQPEYEFIFYFKSHVYFFSVGDFLPPPPPPLDDSSALPSGSGNFPPPPPLDDGAFRGQVRSVVEVMFVSTARNREF